MRAHESGNQHHDRAGIKDQPGHEDQDRQNKHRESHDARTLSRAAAARKAHRAAVARVAAVRARERCRPPINLA
jgi:hypothetical protein